MSELSPTTLLHDSSESVILLLLDDDQNRKLLGEWLAAEYDVVRPDGDAVEDSFDLCIVDETSFLQHEDDLETRTDVASPTFLPYLLVSSDGSPACTPDAWQVVDEVVTTPIEKGVLRARIEGLLERRRLSVELERKRERSVERFQTLFQTAPDPVFVLDAEGAIQAVNDAFCDLTGVSRIEVNGRPIEEVPAFPSDTVESLTADVRADGAAPDRSPYSVAFTAADGETRHAEINTATMPSDDGSEVVGIFRDVTAHWRRRQELKRQNERLDEFAGMLAHELRNPLGIAQGYLRVARKDGTPTAYDEVDNALGRMEQMIDEMLDLARRPETTGDEEWTVFREVVEDTWKRTAPPDATLVLEDTDEEISTDPDRLIQVFRNLFRNAVEHAGDDVTVRVERTSDGIAVEDDGPGIPEDERGDVFESGYTTNDGTGLGLTIVEQIAEAHGWAVDIDAADDGGARFEISGMKFE